MSWEVREGDCLEVLASLPDGSVEAIVTDPPYGLGFMGKEWDALPPGQDWAEECLRVLKPGGHLLAFGGSRTFHRLAVAVEDAGFEIRDQIMWLYGSGFPKSHNLPGGIGTALKPAHEPVVVARKPLIGTVAQNVERFGVGGLNIDGCRVATDDSLGGGAEKSVAIEGKGEGWQRPWMRDEGAVEAHAARVRANVEKAETQGRWPANLVLDEQAGAMLDAQSGEGKSGVAVRHNGVAGGEIGPPGAKAVGTPDMGYGDTGGASRFFYTAKASRAERNAGLDGFEERESGALVATTKGQLKDLRCGDDYERPIPVRANVHPTVKPIDLMRWLVRLVTPPGGTVLDPFTGSGTTGVAAGLEGFDFIGIEREPEYAEIAQARIEWWSQFEGDTTDILQRAGLAEKAQAEHVERGQLDLLGEAA
jgi:site-specific DNA-methyltransferase (adenine-specific)